MLSPARCGVDLHDPARARRGRRPGRRRRDRGRRRAPAAAATAAGGWPAEGRGRGRGGPRPPWTADHRHAGHPAGSRSAGAAARPGRCAGSPRHCSRSPSVLATASVVALVVTPAMSALLYRPPASGGRSGAAPGWARRGLDRLAAGSGRPRAAAAVAAVLLLLAAAGRRVAASRGHAPVRGGPRRRRPPRRPRRAPRCPRRTGSPARSRPSIGELAGVRSVGTPCRPRRSASDRVVDADASEIWLTIDDDADYRGPSPRSGRRCAPTRGCGARSAPTPTSSSRPAGTTTGDQLVVRVYGQDPATLRAMAEDVRQEIQTVPGVLCADGAAAGHRAVDRDPGGSGGGSKGGAPPGRRPSGRQHPDLGSHRRPAVRGRGDLRRRPVGWSALPGQRERTPGAAARHPVRWTGAAGGRRPGARRGHPERDHPRLGVPRCST